MYCEATNIQIIRCMGTSPCFSTNFTKGDNFCDFLMLLGQCSPFKIGSTLKGKNLLLVEQILFL